MAGRIDARPSAMDRFVVKSKPWAELAAGKAARAEQNRFAGPVKKMAMPESFYKKPYDRKKAKRPIGPPGKPSRTTGSSSRPSTSASTKTAEHDSASTGPVAGPSKPKLPQSAFYSSAYRATIKKLTSTLDDPSNPITHNDGYSRAQHIVSCATGHQQSNGGRSRDDANSWQKSRVGKLREQAAEKETDILKGVCICAFFPPTFDDANLTPNRSVDINGFTGEKITNQELIKLVERHGGTYLPMQSFKRCTHIVTCRGLNGKKTEAEMQRKRGGCLIVTPDWILESVEAGRRLPEWRYKIVEAENQASISSKFGGPSTSMARTTSAQSDSTGTSTNTNVSSTSTSGKNRCFASVEPIDLVSDSDSDVEVVPPPSKRPRNSQTEPRPRPAASSTTPEVDEEEERLWAALGPTEDDDAPFDEAMA